MSSEPMAKYLEVARILLDSFSAISFTLLAILCIRNRAKRRMLWGGNAYTWMAAVGSVHFILRLANGMLYFALGRGAPVLTAIDGAASALIPPLLVHLFYTAEKAWLPGVRFWRAFLVLLYAASGAVNLVQPAAHKSVLGVAAVATALVIGTSRRRTTGSLEARQRRWLLVLAGAMAVLYLARHLLLARWLLVLESAIPLGFLFVITYYVERFTFFDVLIKKGAFAFFALFLLMLYFLTVGTWLLQYRLTTLGWALSVWPVMLFYPWGCRKVSAWLDRVWLGRRFTPDAAGKYFLSGLEGAITGEELACRAERHLREIFQTEAEVRLGVVPDEGDWMRAAVRVQGEAVGEIRIRPREQATRLLSEDLTLLASLAGTFSFLLENLRLREKRLEQEKRERELLLNANRLQLKALRAQVNPHFLFNALNTIAGLIPRYPERAERTIEQLAEVFRYTLRRSDREWVRLDEELDAVRAYLDVEQARFGQRLQFRIDATPEAAQARIPAMIVQTLVENAVKHGIAPLNTPGEVIVRATVCESRLQVEVRDNGPGFDPAASRPDSGYGLRNIRERLEGYYGQKASLTIGRQDGVTVVAVAAPRAMEAAA